MMPLAAIISVTKGGPVEVDAANRAYAGVRRLRIPGSLPPDDDCVDDQPDYQQGY